MSVSLAYYIYEVRFTDSSKSPGHGALLRYQFDDGRTGYASVPAWPHLGDDTLEEKLARFRSNPQWEPYWSWAQLDAKLRERKQPALSADIALSPSHWHLRKHELQEEKRWEELRRLGYFCWKLKVTPSLLDELNLRPLFAFVRAQSINLRLDGNGSFRSVAELAGLFSQIKDTSVIDLFEDPSPNETLWIEISRYWNVATASDWIRPKSYSPDICIYKPTRDAVIPAGRDFVITSAFDHPLGLNYTTYRSLQFLNNPRLRMPLGVAHPGLYECDDLPCDVTVGDAGFGWSELLEQTPWRKL